MNAGLHPAAERHDAWTRLLEEVFRSQGVPPGLLADSVAAGVGAYCRRHFPRGVKREELVLLAARAFCAVNERGAAARLLESSRPHGRHAERWLEILSERHAFPGLLPYFSRGIIRPADWAGAQLDRMWTLDFGRLSLAEAERHEMLLYRSVRAIIDHMLVFWDATHGAGVLGLMGLGSLRLEPAGRTRPGSAAPGDLMGYVRGLVARGAQRRGWRFVPQVMDLG